MTGSSSARALMERAGELVVLPRFMRNTNGLGNVTKFKTNDGVLWGLALDGGGQNQMSGVEGIQNAFGIAGEKALGTGMESPSQTGIAIRTITVVPKGLRYHLDEATGVETLSFGMEPPQGMLPPKGGIQADWDRNGFAIIANRDRERCLRDLIDECPDHKLAIYLSNKKGEGSCQALGFFRVDYMPLEILTSLDEGDNAYVANRQEGLRHKAHWKGEKAQGVQKQLSGPVPTLHRVA